MSYIKEMLVKINRSKVILMTPLLFSTFEVTTQAFYRASLSFAIVNLKPIVPGRKDFAKRLNRKLEES